MSNTNQFKLNNFSVSSTNVTHMDHFDDLQSVSSESSTLVPAVLVQNARKSYQTGQIILNNMNMNVATGSIYGLLGGSGCGKTSILSCIVGLRSLDSGTIKIFGHKPGSTGVPCRILGYMPQDVALYDVFTVTEILNYFGRLYSMTNLEVKARTEFLIGFLDLPKPNNLIRNLSGGQKRRVSLAIALLHRPKLMILDEPTVGLDPLLRESIWNHLVLLVEKQRITILLTTHYIEEARQSNTVGIMRNGRLLVEQSPEKLLTEYGTPFLEHVFLRLCVDDEQGLIPDTRTDYDYFNLNKNHKSELNDKSNIKGIAYRSGTDDSIWTKDTMVSPLPKYQDQGFAECASKHVKIIFALLIKTCLYHFRTPWFGLIILLMPYIQTSTFLMVLGHDPKNIALGIVSPELQGENLLDFCKIVPRNECFPTGISCRYFETFPKEEFKWIVYKSDEEALKGVENGNTWGYISIPHNYSQHMLDRSLEKNYVTNSTLDGTLIVSRLDASYNLKSDFIKFKIYEYFQTFLKELASTCNTNPKMVEVPLKFNSVFGSFKSNTYLQYMQPGFFVLTIFLLPMSCALRIIHDRKVGVQQRSQVAGLQFSHTLIELLISQGIIVAVQVMICYTIMTTMGEIIVAGAVWQLLLLVFLMGMVGLLLAFLVSLSVDEELECVYIILACYLPLLVSSGGTWPFDGMPKLARFIYSSSPTALPIKALRSICSRGWGLEHPEVRNGFAMAICWIIVLCVLSDTCHLVAINCSWFLVHLPAPALYAVSTGPTVRTFTINFTLFLFMHFGTMAVVTFARLPCLSMLYNKHEAHACVSSLKQVVSASGNPMDHYNILVHV